MKSKLALFDLDGTLYDTRMVNYLSYNEALKQYGAEIDYNYFARYCNGKKYSTFLPEIIEEKYIENVHRLKVGYYKKYIDQTKENINLFDIIECIKQKYYIALVTTASKRNTLDILTEFNREELFDLIVTQEMITNPKPNPEGFLYAMEYFGIDKENTIIFEDSDVGILAAESTGAKVYVVKGYA